MLLGSAFTETLPAILLLIAFTVVGGVVIFIARKKLKSPTSESDTYSLSELKTMLSEGVITQEEYDKAYESIVGMYQKDDRYLTKSGKKSDKERKL